MKVIACAFQLCLSCKAPPGVNLPPDGSFTVKRGKHGIDRVTTHFEGCPRGFKKVEIPDVEE